MDSAPQSLLRPVPCPACGRPGRELSPCPWCGERAPVSPRTRGDFARLAAGFALLAAAAGSAAAAATDVHPVVPAVPAGIAASAAGRLSGFFLVRAASPLRAGPLLARAFGEAGWGSLAAALFASFLALAFRAFAVPHPIPSAARFAWLLPAVAATCFALRVPAEAPDAPASGASPRERARRRHAPDLLAAITLAPFAALFAARGPSLLSLPGLALVLGVWFSRLARPAAPLFLSAVCFVPLLPDPAFFAFGILAAGLYRAADA